MNKNLLILVMTIFFMVSMCVVVYITRNDNSMKTSEVGRELIKEFEGCKQVAYQDSVGVWTIGYGHTKDVYEGQLAIKKTCDRFLEEDLDEFEGYVDSYVKVELNQNQFDALVAWTFNLGPGNLSESTMLRKLNEGDYDAVPDEMRRWNKAGGEVLNGLVRRRDAEANLFSS
jgi:GH24 family phage-related lysozyme (muramidase)